MSLAEWLVRAARLCPDRPALPRHLIADHSHPRWRDHLASVMAGYWNNAQASASTLKAGWLWTGDVGIFDEDGFLTLKGRSKDVKVSGATSIGPREVEKVLLTHHSVADVSVVGMPNAEWGEDLVAFVVTKSKAPLDEAGFDRHCLSEIARFKRPKAYSATDSLPKNNYPKNNCGKVLKTELPTWLARITQPESWDGTTPHPTCG